MVASLLDKAPNLAGLSRTCEVTFPPHSIHVCVDYQGPMHDRLGTKMHA